MKALRFLLDTSALLAHNRQEPGWAHVQALFEEDGSEVLAASLSLTEFARHLRELGATAGEARRTVKDYRELLSEIVPVDERVALTAFDIGCEIEGAASSRRRSDRRSCPRTRCLPGSPRPSHDAHSRQRGRADRSLDRN
jgi:predicted nucleic acid-binding protein